MMTPGYIQFQFENNTPGRFLDFTTAVCQVLDSDAPDRLSQIGALREAMDDGARRHLQRILGVDSDDA